MRAEGDHRAVKRTPEKIADLVSAARTGDVRAFGTVVARFQDMAYAAAFSRLGSREMAEDAAQEAFVEAFLHLDGLREPAAFPGWFRQILRRQCTRLLRGAHPVAVPLEVVDHVPAPEPGPEAEAIRSERRRRVQEAIRALPESEREATLLYYMRGCSQPEIASFLGVPTTTVKKRLYTARRRLQDGLLSVIHDEMNSGKPSQDERFVRVVELCSAAAKGQLETVRELLASQPDLVKAQDRYGDTALGRAARWGHAEVVRELLARGADPRVTREGPDRGWSPLFWACGYRANPEIVALLLDHAADPNGRASHHGAVDDTALHTAARWGHTEVMELLVTRGADVHARCGAGDHGDDGCTPLRSAAKRGHREAVELLAARGAHFDLFSAAALGNVAQLTFLLDSTHSPIDAADTYGATPLHAAVIGGHAEAATCLLDRGADVNHQDRKGRTALLLAAIAGDPEVTELLLARGASLDLFALAALGRERELAVLLATDPSQTRAADAHGWSALHWSGRTGQTGTARLLLNRGADVNARDADGRTPLWPAAYEGRHEAVVQLLIERGVDLQIRDRLGHGILAYDVGRDCYALLQPRGAVE
jgi:RNA polymerase sigma factor (sigma-70 family)